MIRNRRGRVGPPILAVMLLAAACSGASGDSQLAVGAAPTTVATTGPLAMPTPTSVPEARATPVLSAAAPSPVATLPPASPTAEPVPSAPASPGPTTAPAPAAPAAPPTATEVPAAAAPPPTATEVPAAAAPPAGLPIFLGDFEVVNLLSGASENIAALAPTGPTMLWFWAPH